MRWSFALTLCWCAISVYGLNDLEIIHQWNFADFDFPDFETASKFR